MQFMFSLIAEERSWENVTPEEVKRNVAEMGKFNEELAKIGAMVTGAGLQERATGTTVHYGDGGETVVSDGPFAETKEQLAGFWIVELPNADEALEWAKRIPLQSGHVEIRPLVSGEEEMLEKAAAS
jgi:hypothetical protein